MGKKITVIGAGGTGCCAAGVFTLHGHDVTLCEETGVCEQNIQDILDRGGFELTGAADKGYAPFTNITHDFASAVNGSEYIIITALSTRHDALIRKIVPYLEDGQVIMFSAGSCGSIAFRAIMKELGVEKNVLVGELEGNLFPCRIRGKATGYIGMPAGKPWTVAAFPAKDNDKYVAALSELSKVIPATNVFETTLNASNIIVHLGGSLLNTGAVESTDNFCFYDTGLTPSVLRMIEALGVERDAISAKLGYTVRSSVGFMKQLADKEHFPQFSGFRSLEGPLTMGDRYIFEDAQNGATFLSSLGDQIGSPAPIARALVTVASAINGTDYYGEGRTMEKMGLAGKTAEEINKFLYEGTL